MKGPGEQGKGVNSTAYTVPDLIMAFTNDDQIAEVTAAMGIFDAEGLLPDDHIPAGYISNVAHWIYMRGTVAFEVLHCQTKNYFKPNDHSNSTYIRILFNDAVYPVVSCQSGPGRSCPLADYAALIKSKCEAAGNFNDFCNVTAPGHPTTVAGASFFTDLTLHLFSLS
ncbi:hypothetical protein CDV55_100874 [Aspergillus turcosus]|nr:hypothetical protein CDV55_100874 [Aspergillus turcosus]